MAVADRHPDFPRRSVRATARDLREILRPERRMMAGALACAVIGPVAALAVPFAAKLVIDDVIGRGRTELLLPIALGTAGAVAVQAGATFGAAHAGTVAGNRAVARLRRRLQRHALQLPVAFFDATPTGTLVSRTMTDAEQVRQFFGAGVAQLVSGALTATIALAILLTVDWRLGLAAGALVVAAAIGLGRGFRRVHPLFRAVSESQADLAGRLTETLGGVRIVKAHTAERREASTLAHVTHEVTRASVRAGRHVAALIAAIALASGGVSLVLLVLGGQAVVREALTLGDLALVVLIAGLLVAPLIQVAALGSDLGRALAAMARVQDVLALPAEDAGDRSRAPVPTVTGAVDCQAVSYRYGSGCWALRQVTLRAPAGSTTALTGPNGAGKSTLLRLLMGWDDPTAGRILIDGRPLVQLRRRDYRGHLGVVLQHDLLLNGTIADTIRYGRPNATTAELRRAARLAHCDEFIEALPHGYDTVVGERGVRLSGGQRQRVAIARALLADPRILLLDEATSQLDVESERLIQEALSALCGGRTTFVIAHRAGTLERADQVVVLRRGEVVEVGGGIAGPSANGRSPDDRS